MAAEPKLDIPILIDAVGHATPDEPRPDVISALPGSVANSPSVERELLIAELQTEIAASMFALTDDIMRQSFAEMEASVFERISARLRSEMPEIIDALLRARLSGHPDD